MTHAWIAAHSAPIGRGNVLRAFESEQAAETWAAEEVKAARVKVAVVYRVDVEDA